MSAPATSKEDRDDDRPERGGRRARLELPPTIDLAAIEAAAIAVIQAAAEGHISSRKALDFTLMLEHRRRIVADRDLETKIRDYEKKAKGLKP